MSAPSLASTTLAIDASSEAVASGRGGQFRTAAKGLLRGILSALGAVIFVMVIWIGFIKAYHIDPLVAKSPLDVWKYLTSGGDPSEPSSQLWHGLTRTLSDAGVGFIAGLVAAAVVAISFVLSRSVEQAMMPLAIVIRSVPLVAMTPLITLVFGRDILGTTVISGIVVFFPALVTIGFGLRSTSKQAADVVRAYGGTDWAVTRKVMLPSALPALFASARVGVPGALVGATLAEYLATGKGLGYLMLFDVQQFNYDQLWSAVVVLTGVSVLIYYAVGAIETAVLARFGPAPSRR